MKRIVAGSAEPELAVFWYVPDRDLFIGDRGALSDGVYFGDFGQLNYDHFDRWETWKNEYRLPDVEYDYYPRGRVMFNAKIHKYVVICDPCIANDVDLRKSLCYEYGLDPRKVVWDTDEHYECNKCRVE